MPAIKLPSNSNSCVEVSIFIKISVCTKTTAIKILKIISIRSCIKNFVIAGVHLNKLIYSMCRGEI